MAADFHDHIRFQLDGTIAGDRDDDAGSRSDVTYCWCHSTASRGPPGQWCSFHGDLVDGDASGADSRSCDRRIGLRWMELANEKLWPAEVSFAVGLSATTSDAR